ncbi:MAG: DegT/DnrJ/EryC1/StrS family aminotransferase [Bacteroidia bacterium]|nr:DegT/DnrJ/EryC1/StrS family aminotransferase [Bacteroidia bacterium]
MHIKMVDLEAQFRVLESEIRRRFDEVLQTTAFINGRAVKDFAAELAAYLGVKKVVPCANGTDALQIALMALDLQPGDEVVVPDFTYISTVEVAALLRLTPVPVDVDPFTFNLDPVRFAEALTPRTKAVVPVHLFGQCADMDPILDLAQERGVFVVEDAAQAVGARYTGGKRSGAAGTLGTVGCTSFYPSKNLSCYGDGGAMFTQDEELAQILETIANHGQSRRYYFDRVGVNSRLDSLQAAVLSAKLPLLDSENEKRRAVARRYDEAFADLSALRTPVVAPYSTHVYHQYTVVLENERLRDGLSRHLTEKNIPNVVFYPLPVHAQNAYRNPQYTDERLPVATRLSKTVLSLPMHAYLTDEQVDFVVESVREYFTKI